MRKTALTALILLLVAAPPLAGQEWTAEQQEVVDWINAFAAEAYAGDTEGYMAWMHPDFTGWEYTAEEPFGGEEMTKMLPLRPGPLTGPAPRERPSPGRASG